MESRTQSLRPRPRPRTQKNPRPRPRIKDTSASAKKSLHKNFSGDLKKKKIFFFRRSPQRNVFQKVVQALQKILTIQKMLLSSSRGQANFRGLEAKANADDFKMYPRGRPRGQGCPRGLHLCNFLGCKPVILYIRDYY